MAVSLQPPDRLLPISGVRLASCAAGIRYKDRPDLALVELAPGSRTAAVFTRNAFCAAPVIIAKRHLKTAAPRYLLINAGNANAGLGERGIDTALAACRALADARRCRIEEILPFSTGAIGEPLPVEKIAAALSELIEGLSPEGWRGAAEAIMTTDTVPKGISETVSLDGKAVHITGIAKGSGMIRPDMATMLAFVATDAAVAGDLLAQSLREAVGRSFNRITVDGDTSTNDACVLIATGRSGVEIGARTRASFMAALQAVMQHLAQAIVRDGEGATKFVRIRIERADSDGQARRMADAIAHSPLVKTALFASDPNWGRILAALGRAGSDDLDIHRVTLLINGLRIARDGAVDPTYTEPAGRKAMAGEEITVTVDLQRGRERIEIWTTDLSYDYVRINAEYRS